MSRSSARSALALSLLAVACTQAAPPPPPPPPVDLCAAVACDAAAGLVCAAADGRCHCGTAAGPVCAAGETCAAEAARCETPAPVTCNPPSRWAPGTPAFREATARFGLDALGVQGTRLASVDVDGDGWADLFVRRGGNAADDFAPMGTRQSWLLLNDRRGGFVDVTETSGVRALRGTHDGALGRPGEVVAFADVDNDGDLDVYTGMATRVAGALAGETSELLLNDGAAHFGLGPEDGALRRAAAVDAPAGASFLDYDRDGRIDLWVGEASYTSSTAQATVFQQDRLWRGDGAGRFVEVTAEVGLTTEDWFDVDTINEGRAHARAWSSAACDLDEDGTPELLVASYGRAPNHLFQGRGDPRSGGVVYENRSVASGYAFDQAQDWTDNEFARCWCQTHRAAPGCADVPPPRVQCSNNWNDRTDRQPFRLGGNSGTTVCADLDGDGHLDLLTTEITHWWAGSSADRSELLLNTGEADVRFERPGNERSGLTRPTPAANWDYGDMTAAVFDFDNDGLPDVYLGASDYAGNHGLLFHQLGAAVFESVPVEQGIDHHRSHGIAVADLDRDGDLDVVVGHSRARCDSSAPDDCYPTAQVRVFENVLGQDGNWVQLSLEGGEGTNRAAIGARVTVTTDAGTQVQEVGGGHGHYGIQHDLVLHFGLGAACEAEVEVRWPDAELHTQRFRVVSGHRLRVKQGLPPEPVAR